jgi:branched-chain amino acid transport system ATP-binding protein
LDDLLSVQGVDAGYGNIPVLHRLTFEVRRGETVAILGPNGAGKTTTARMLAGAIHPSDGRVELGGDEVTRWSVEDRVRRGLVLVPENRHIFTRLTVRENLLVGAYCHPRKEARNLERIMAYFPELKPKLRLRGGELSGGQQQMLAVGRALMSEPRMLILDEPTLGLAPIVIQRLGGVLREINARDTVSILLIDQRFSLVEQVASRAYVLRGGRIQGSMPIRGASREVIESWYMGAFQTASDAPANSG